MPWQAHPRALAGTPSCPGRHTLMPWQAHPHALADTPSCPGRHTLVPWQAHPRALAGTLILGSCVLISALYAVLDYRIETQLTELNAPLLAISKGSLPPWPCLRAPLLLCAPTSLLYPIAIWHLPCIPTVLSRLLHLLFCLCVYTFNAFRRSKARACGPRRKAQSKPPWGAVAGDFLCHRQACRP